MPRIAVSSYKGLYNSKYLGIKPFLNTKSKGSFCGYEIIIGIVLIPVLTVYFLTPYYIEIHERKARAITLNYEGKRVVTTGGVILLTALVFSNVFLYFRSQNFYPFHQPSVSWFALIYFAGVTLLGAVDDIRGEKKCKGFSGHLNKLWRREGISTGIYKAAGGGLLGAALSAYVVGISAWPEWIFKGLFLALFSNIFNLLDTRPARATKVFLVLSLVLMLIKGPFPVLFSLWSALYVYLFWEMKKSIMLGDAGAYLLGGVLGYYLILNLSLGLLIAISFMLVFLHWYLEKFSLSRLLEEKVLFYRLNRTNGRG